MQIAIQHPGHALAKVVDSIVVIKYGRVLGMVMIM